MIAATAVAAGFLFFAPPAFAGSTDNVTGWAWSASIGWISMNCTNDATCGTVNYGVTIDNTPGFGDRGDLHGWAWSETVGWICFGYTCTGTTPEGGTPYAQYRASWNSKNDQFYGWAQILSMGSEGWISLNCDYDVGTDACPTSNYFTILNNANGNFTQLGATDHWGWGVANTGNGTGWIDFSSVNTSWTLAKIGTIKRPEGVYEPSNAGLPGTHLFQFPITFTNFSGATNQMLLCQILLPDGSQRVITKVLTSAVRNGSTSMTYTVQNADNVQQNKIWYITKCMITGTPNATVCTVDANCGANGVCDTSLGKCRDIIDQSNRRRPIYTHVNSWTGLNAAQDQYLAIKCNAGFPNNYFKNAAQCDFTGDASFALAMRRGFPVEGNCGDGIDNDGNGQIDCADRYCQGVSYRCQTLQRTTCTYGLAGDNLLDCNDATYVNGDLCCTQQPISTGSSLDHVVDGLECTHGDVQDGYFDCDCDMPSKYGIEATDCYAPGAVTGDLCCDTGNNVVKK